MPATSSADRATYAALDLIDALQHPAPAAPFATFGDAQLQALRALTAIFYLNIAKGTGLPSKHHLQPHRLPVAPPRVGPTQGEPDKPTAAASAPRVLDKLATHSPEHSRPDPPPKPTKESPERRLMRSNTKSTQPAPRYPLQSRMGSAFHVCAIAPAEANAVTDVTTGRQLEYRHLVKGPTKEAWVQSFANELGRLAQGVLPNMPSGSNTIRFVAKSAVPRDRKVMYGCIVVEIRPQKAETHRTRLTVGGNLIEYPGDVSTPTADLTTAKCLFNSTISTPGA